MDDTAMAELIDRAAIERVLYDYCAGIDRCDEELLRSAYHDDAYDDHGVFQGDASEFVTFALGSLRKIDLATQHLVSNVRIDLDGDHATCQSYVVARHVREKDGARRLLTYGGRYLDRMERRDGRWRIAHRLFVSDWDKVEVTDRATAHDRYTPGGRHPDDPSYHWDEVVVRL